MTALAFFEHFITFKYEVDMLWRRKWSVATWIFVLNRYLLVGDVVSSLVPYSAQVSHSNSIQSAVADFCRCKPLFANNM